MEQKTIDFLQGTVNNIIETIKSIYDYPATL